MPAIIAQVMLSIYAATGIILVRHEFLTEPAGRRPDIFRALVVMVVGPAVLLWAIINSIPDFIKDAPCDDDAS